MVLQRSTQLIGLCGGGGGGGAPALGAHGSITAKRVEAGRGIASCCGRMCATLHQKQFGSARGHALTTQGMGEWVGCLAGRNQGAKQLATQPAGPSFDSPELECSCHVRGALGRCLPSSFPCPPRALSQDCHFTKARSSHLLHWGHLTGERHLQPFGGAWRCQDAPE